MHSVRLGLHRMERALADLDRPDRRFPVLLVAGTNGKGSTSALAASALQMAGYRVGLYTSPHLHRFAERVQINGRPVGDEELADGVQTVRRVCTWQDDPAHQDRLTYFELATLLSMLCFARYEVDVAVVETGLGGQFDATAVLAPCVMAVTRIGLDHLEYFGTSLAEVARAEASIFKPGVPVAVAPGQPSDAMEVLRTEAARIGAPLSVCREDYEGPLALRGAHQRQNAAVANKALELLGPRGLSRAQDAVTCGFASTRWPGRFEDVAGVLLDVAHNPDGAQALAHGLRDHYPERPVELVFGVSTDKDYRGILRILARSARHLHLCPPLTRRSLAPTACAAFADEIGLPSSVYSSCTDALHAAQDSADSRGGLVCTTGSFNVVAEVRRLLLDSMAPPSSAATPQ
jgi:dihydrofolate synthase/folylpolyglutamate synthase